MTAPDSGPEESVSTGSRPEARLVPHDLGCRCWPHVSQRDAVAAIEEVALAEYRDGLRRPAAAPAEGLREAWALLEEVRTDSQRYGTTGLVTLQKIVATLAHHESPEWWDKMGDKP